MADNENINFTTDIIDTEIYEQDVGIIDETKDVVVETEIKTIEVFETDVDMVESDSAFSPIGEANEALRHTLLTERDVSDQHPITAITGLRNELDGIKALKTVYADKMGIANYYKWNNGAYNEYGYFVSLVPHTSEIKICDGADIFGVTVDAAGFIGGQDESVPRDNTYALVATSGLVSVRCETTVIEGDYVVSNAYGRAEKTDSGCGYKVVTIENKNGTNYALISLGIQVCTTDMLGQQIQHLDGRMDDAESDIVEAMNAANAAYKKAGEIGVVSEEAIKNALEALDKANGASEKTDEFEKRLSTSNALAEEAKNIALLATTTAAGIANEAVETSNKTLENVNNLIADLEPISSWGTNGEYITVDTWVDTDKDANKTYYVTDTKLYYYYYEDEWVSVSELSRGAEYLTTYIKDDLATKAEVYTVEILTNDNKSAIEKNAEEFSTFVSSVDKYSVGEYSQAYGLTHEQAKSILKVGMIYIPANNPKGTTHIETYEGQGQDNYFTEGRYYEWDGDDWQEHTIGKVWISNTIPANSNGAYKYWYVDSNEAPEGYEAHTLYMYDGEQWVKVNILDGNVNNRITSMIKQTADKIAIDVVNAQGDISSHQQWLDNNSANIQDVVSWKSDVENDVSNIATIKQTADDAGASIAQVAGAVSGKYEVVDTWSLSSATIGTIYYAKDNKKYYYYKDGVWVDTTSPTEAGLEVNAASIITSINNDTTGVTIKADHIDISGKTIDLTAGNITIASDKFNVDKDGNIEANSGFLGGWKIDVNGIHSNTTSHIVDLWAPNNKPDESAQWIFMFTDNTGAQPTYPFVVKKDGTLIANKATIAGDSNIGGWTISGTAGLIQENDSFKVHIKPPTVYGGLGTAAADFIVLTDKTGDKDTYPFVISSDGTVKATKAIITGNSVIEGDCIVRGKLDGAGLVKLHSSTDVINGLIDFNTTERDGEVYGTIKMLIYYDGWQEDSDTDNNRFRGGVSITGSPVYDTGPWVTISGGRVAIDAHIYDTGNASVYSETNTIETSDQNLKNTITSISSSYSTLFDSLRPVTFKFNNGTSGRLHTGFIAQEVDEAISVAGLTRQDFAGLCILNEGAEDERWGLRYGEFVALNTYEIQKLKARVAELEVKLENKEN